MIIEQIKIANEGFIVCESSFYRVKDILNGQEFLFTKGLNLLEGDIDSGIFGISYLISMHNRVDSANLFMPLEVLVNNSSMPLSKLTEYSCYLDQSNDMFSASKSVREQVMEALNESRIEYNVEEIESMFQLTDFRFNSPISAVGNERFKAMAAIGFSAGKQIFCFPWFSKMRFEYFSKQIYPILDVLTKESKIIVLPVGK